MIKIIIDRHIPYIFERVEEKAQAVMLDPAEITPEAVHDADALIVRTRTKCNEALLGGSRVRLVGTGTIGFDHIDREWCASRGIETVNSAGCNAPAVAQYVVATLTRAGYDPRRHTLGIVGKGHIGSILTAVVRNAGGRVLVCDPPRAEEGYMDERYLELGEILERCDAVSFHVPLTRKGEYPTWHLLDAGGVRRLKPEAIIVNASRGGVIDEEAVLAYAKPGQRWIIDTWEGEPELNRRMLERAFIATPHIAGYSEEGKQRATRRMIEALNRRFGLAISTDGLSAYDFDPFAHDFKEIAASFDPWPEDQKLRADAGSFEILRDTYRFRPEPSNC